MAQITAKGFISKSQNEYYAEETALYRNIDPTWNLDPSTPDGLKVASDAENFGALDQVLLQAYNSKDPLTARDVDLDKVCFLNNVRRTKGSRSNVELKLIGVPGTIVDRGKRVSSKTTGERWVIEQGYALDVNGEAFVNAYSERIGMIEADPHTLTQIVDVVGGWIGVTNPNPAIVGRDAQTDGQLRLARNQQVSKVGSSQVDAMKGAVYSVQDVRRVQVYENDTSTTDSIGLPGHSTCVVVDGGLDDDIARQIYNKRNPGTQQYTPTTPVSVDVYSLIFPTDFKEIKFSRPEYVDVEMLIVIKNDGSLPANVEELIKEAFMEFTSGELIPMDVGFKRSGFDIGEEVPLSTLNTPVNQVIGQYGNSYIKSLTVTGAVDGVLPISPFQLSRWTTANITVNIS